MITDYGYMEYSGRTLKWCDSDSEQIYKKNYTTNRSELEQNGWIDIEIDYTFNFYGFRTAEFDINVQGPVLFLGCSHTMGIGLKQEQTFVHHVGTALGKPFYNLSKGGAANNTLFRFASVWIPRLRPSKVIVMTTYRERIEFLDPFKGSFISYLPNDTRPDDDYLKWYHAYLARPENANLQRSMCLNAIENLCTKHGADYHVFDIDSKDVRSRSVDLARDLAHFGPQSHKNYADWILNNIT